MNSSPNRASQTAEKSKRKDLNLDYATARQMLPYVRSIVTDIVGTASRLHSLTTEQETLDEYRRSLSWASRERRYAITDEVSRTQTEMTGAIKELTSLGLNLIDSQAGAVDFPTRINGRPAAYSWHLGEDALTFWHYAGEELRRPIPADWQQLPPLPVASDN